MKVYMMYVYKDAKKPRCINFLSQTSRKFLKICILVFIAILSYTCFHILNYVITDMYSTHIGQCAEVDSLLQRLRTTVKQEVDYMKQLMEAMGTMDMLFAATSANQNRESNFKATDILTPSVGAQTS